MQYQFKKKKQPLVCEVVGSDVERRTCDLSRSAATQVARVTCLNSLSQYVFDATHPVHYNKTCSLHKIIKFARTVIIQKIVECASTGKLPAPSAQQLSCGTTEQLVAKFRY